MAQFTILVEKRVTIPDDKMLELYDNAIERFGEDDIKSLGTQDLVTQAMLDGVIEDIGLDWDMDADDSDWWTREEVVVEFSKKKAWK